MILARSRSRVLRRSSRAALAVVATLAVGCGVAGGLRLDDATRSDESGKRIAAATARTERPRCDGPEHDLGIQWEESLQAAFERGRREKKPVLIAFSARRQDIDFGGEF